MTVYEESLGESGRCSSRGRLSSLRKSHVSTNLGVLVRWRVYFLVYPCACAFNGSLRVPRYGGEVDRRHVHDALIQLKVRGMGNVVTLVGIRQPC